MIAQSGLSELCVLRFWRGIFVFFYSHSGKSATELWDTKLMDVFEALNGVLVLEPKLKREGPMRFQGRAGLFLLGDHFVKKHSRWTLPVLDIVHSF